MYIQINDNFDEELKDAEYYDVNAEERLSAFGPVSTINLFVGVNNSGKSRFLRTILKKSNVLITSEKINVKDIFDKLEEEIRKNQAVFGESSFGIKINKAHSIPNFFANPITPPEFKKLINIIKSNIDIYDLKNSLSEYVKEIKKLFSEFRFTDLSEYIQEVSLVLDLIDGIYDRKYDDFFLNQAQMTSSLVITPSVLGKNFFKNPIKEFNIIFKKLEATSIIGTTIKNPLYIPILRSSHSLYENEEFSKIKADIFETSIINHYFLNEKKSTQIVVSSGQKLYETIRKHRNSFRDKRILFEEFEKFLGTTFFNTEEFEIIAREDEKDSGRHITVSIKGEEQDIHNLGDGIQSLITLLFPIYVAEPETWVFIEEPEINLHPGMQRIFLEQLTKEPLKSKKLKYFITTHSNHLLDLSLEMGEETSIFTFDKKILEGDKAHFEIKNVKSGDTDVLNLLGVKNSSVFMANCTIWVEGITDRYYIREFLKAYYKQFEESTVYKEDLHYAFFEYAGTNIEHYIFEEPALIKETPAIKAQFLSNKILLVADMDKGKEKRHLKRELAQYKNFQFELLSVREIENLLSEQNLSELLPKVYTYFKHNIDFTKIKFSEYKEKYLARYLETTFGNKVVGKAFIAESGTINTKYKLDLALAAKDNLTWENMSEPAKELAKKIYKFIKKANS
ncbi:MAG: AAA family ATPase [Bacteroidetes bacterium]|nr:MAG: AAA family ATPase [Bacteroidota bacterium]